MLNKETSAATPEVDPDALRAAEFLAAQQILDSLVGKTIASATMEEKRVAVSTTDGLSVYFYGFLGGRIPVEDNEDRSTS